MFTPSKVLYFTAGPIPTIAELADVDALQNDGRYSVFVRSAIGGNYTGGEPEATDYVAGTIPTAYADAETYPVLDAGSTLGSDQAIITDGVAIVGTGGSFTPTVVDGVVTGGTWA